MAASMSREQKKLASLLGVIAVLLLVIAFWPTVRVEDYEVQVEQNPVIETTTEVRVETLYLDCRHTETQIIAGNSAFAGMNAEMLVEYGYSLVWQEGVAVLSTEKTGYCPACLQKCHLRIYQEGLGVFTGPLEGDGELLYYLDIPLHSLPARWLAQLTSSGIEFPDEETLLMALDNLDEMIEYIDPEQLA